MSNLSKLSEAADTLADLKARVDETRDDFYITGNIATGLADILLQSDMVNSAEMDMRLADMLALNSSSTLDAHNSGLRLLEALENQVYALQALLAEKAA